MKDAVKDIQEVLDAVDELASIQNKAVLQSFGVDPDSDSSSEDEQEEDIDKFNQNFDKLPLLDIAKESKWNFLKFCPLLKMKSILSLTCIFLILYTRSLNLKYAQKQKGTHSSLHLEHFLQLGTPQLTRLVH